MITIRDNFARWIFIGIAACFFLYGGIKLIPYLSGPSVEIYSPEDNGTIASSTFSVSGRVLRAKTISLQGKAINVDTEGYFNETLVSYSPYTILTLEATDKYGKTVEKRLTLTPSLN